MQQKIHNVNKNKRMARLTQNQIEAQEVYAPTERTRQTQCQRVLDYIDRFGFITSMGALHGFGCARLASRISDIESRCGRRFKRTRERVITRLGQKATIVRYSYEDGTTREDYACWMHNGRRYEQVDITTGRALL